MSRPELSLVAWICAAFAAAAVAGLAILPSAAVVWLVLLLFAVLGIPQALLWRGDRRATGRHGDRRDDSGDGPGRG